MKTFALAGLIAAMFAGAAQAQALSAADAQTLLKGKTFNTKDFGGEGTITWNDDMTIAVDVTKPDGSKVQDTGTYRFDDKGYCSTWKTVRTTEKCFTLSKTGDKTYDILNTDGSVDSQLTAQ